MNWETWGPPLAVLGVGAVVGIFLTLRMRAGDTGAAEARTHKQDLEARKASLMEQLRTLDADRAALDPDEWQSRRDELVDEAARVLEALDGLAPALATEATPGAAPSEAAPAEPETAPPGRRAVWAFAAVVFFVVLGIGLVQFSAPKSDQGGMGMGGGAAPAAQEVPAQVQQAMASLQSDPQNLALLNELTYYFLLVQDTEQAMGYLDRARLLDPGDADVLTHLAMLQGSVGMFDRALPTIESAIAKAPDRGKPLLWKGYIIASMGSGPKAVEALQAAMAKGLTAEEAQFAAAILAEAETLPDVPVVAQESVPSGSASMGHPGMGAPPAPAAAPAEAVVPAGAKVAGSVKLAEGSAAPQGGVLFVMVRPAATSAGPPIAARRLAPAPLPQSFALSDADMMMGGEWPEQVWMQARLDADGSPNTKSEADMTSPLVGPLGPGATGLELVLGAAQ